MCLLQSVLHGTAQMLSVDIMGNAACSSSPAPKRNVHLWFDGWYFLSNEAAVVYLPHSECYSFHTR